MSDNKVIEYFKRKYIFLIKSKVKKSIWFFLLKTSKVLDIFVRNQQLLICIRRRRSLE
jgi:hypothetical protein